MQALALQTNFLKGWEIENDFPYRKKIFLRHLTGRTSKKFKRYTASPLRYAGGKSLAVGYIVENFPYNLQRIVSPFFGGGSVEIACAKELNLDVIGFDIFDILVNYWQVQISNPKELANRLSEFSPTTKGFKEVKERLAQHWKGEKRIEDKIDLAAHYYFNHNTSYGPGFLSWPSSVYMNANRFQSMIEKVRNTTLPNVSIYCNSFETAFEMFPNDFLYCDPPYYLEGDSKMFKGIYPQRNFPIHHNHFAHNKLRNLLHSHKGGFVLSYNDCSTIRDWYKDFRIIDVSWQYTMGQGETRIGVNRMNNGTNHTKKSHELLIVKTS